MNNNDIVEFAKKVIHNEGISGRYELNKHDSGLYSILNRRRLINRVFAHIDLQRIDNARNAVIDALEAFGAANDNATKKDDVA